MIRQLLDQHPLPKGYDYVVKSGRARYWDSIHIYRKTKFRNKSVASVNFDEDMWSHIELWLKETIPLLPYMK